MTKGDLPLDYSEKHFDKKLLMASANLKLFREKLHLEREVYSAPNSRSSSFKKYQKSRGDRTLERRNSVPDDLEICGKVGPLASNTGSIKRVRSFKMTKKGIVNRGDSFSSRSSLCSTGSSSIKKRERLSSSNSDSSSTTNCSCGSNVSSGYYRIAVYGADHVGKRSIVNQFMTSDYMGSCEISTDNDACVSVLLDGEESTLEFCDTIDKDTGANIRADAYIVIFSVDDPRSFNIAADAVGYLRNDLGSDRTIILVANKIDLVRKRQISAKDAKEIANDYRCKYIETSATLNHHVDELLVCVLRQIRILLNPFTCVTQDSKHSSLKKPKGLISRLFRRHTSETESCDNLFEP